MLWWMEGWKTWVATVSELQCVEERQFPYVSPGVSPEGRLPSSSLLKPRCCFNNMNSLGMKFRVLPGMFEDLGSIPSTKLKKKKFPLPPNDIALCSWHTVVSIFFGESITPPYLLSVLHFLKINYHSSQRVEHNDSSASGTLEPDLTSLSEITAKYSRIL